MAHVWRTMLRVLPTLYLLTILGGLLGLDGCATYPAIGRGGPVYAIRVTSVNGNPTAARGPRAYPACLLQVGDQVVRVWLADPSREAYTSPVVLRADAAALKNGILIERSWSEAVVHEVTDAELTAGAALVYVPGTRKHTTVELAFERVGNPPAGPAAPVTQLSGSEPPR